jgi:dihydroorotate dehydrogenase electron transfer subunit
MGLKDNALILENRRINEGAELFDLLVECPEIAAEALPGQIVHVLCGEGTTLRRPISICETVQNTVRLCYDVRGKGTKWLSERMPGEKISLLGALGHGFSPKAGKRALLVGGGIGIYPLLSIGKLYGDRAKALLGFRNISLVNYTDRFEKYGIETSVITDDGSSGRQGFVTELLVEELNAKSVDIVYVCGPKPMMAAVARICGVYGVECEVSMEERMGCGVGACLACVCKTMFVGNDGTVGEKYKRVCVDGPVFNSKEIIWE